MDIGTDLVAGGVGVLFTITAFFFKRTLNSIEGSLRLLTKQHRETFNFLTKLQIFHNRNHPDDKLVELEEVEG